MNLIWFLFDIEIDVDCLNLVGTTVVKFQVKKYTVLSFEQSMLINKMQN